jgi:hypothetical protein
MPTLAWPACSVAAAHCDSGRRTFLTQAFAQANFGHSLSTFHHQHALFSAHYCPYRRDIHLPRRVQCLPRSQRGVRYRAPRPQAGEGEPVVAGLNCGAWGTARPAAAAAAAGAEWGGVAWEVRGVETRDGPAGGGAAEVRDSEETGGGGGGGGEGGGGGGR